MADRDDDELLETGPQPSFLGAPPIEASAVNEDAVFGKGSFWVGLQASLAQRPDGRTEAGALVLLGIPLEKLSSKRSRMRRASIAADTEQPHAPAVAPDAKTEPSEKAPPAAVAESKPVIPVVVTAEIARTVVAKAIEHARLGELAPELDALASRARMSALLPELRLRVTRSMDESQTLSPTEYDPSRVTASGGAGLWLEARATFRLDRLVFADEEMALGRVRRERAEAREKLTAKVLGLLFAWQRALARQKEPELGAEELLASQLAEIEAEVALDVVTGGWFSKWRAREVARLK